MSNDNLPPGVSASDPHLTGEWPCDECGGAGFDEDEDGKHACDYCEGKGWISGEEKYFDKTYICPDCGTDVTYDEDTDDWKCSDTGCGDGVPSRFTYKDVLYELKEKR